MASNRAATIEELVALNDEIVSLVQAGVPLEFGLLGFGRDQSAKLHGINTTIAERMSRGESLGEAVAAESDRFPDVYRAIIEAGLKSGRLTSALEATSRFASDLADLRQRIGVALLYPLIVFSVAYGLFVVFLLAMTRRFYDAHTTLAIPVGSALKFFLALEQTALYWCWIPPVVLAGLATWWHRRSNAHSLDGLAVAGPLKWLPAMKRIFKNYRYANFSDLLSLLVEHDVPLPEGIVLAADATGDENIQRSARLAAEAIQRGDSLSAAAIDRHGFPPFLGWLISRNSEQRSLARSLRIAADLYRHRAIDLTDWLKVGFPIIAGIVIGGGSTLLYSLALFLPLLEMLRKLSG